VQNTIPREPCIDIKGDIMAGKLLPFSEQEKRIPEDGGR